MSGSGHFTDSEPMIPSSGPLVRRMQKISISLGLAIAIVGAGHVAAWLSGHMRYLGLTNVTMKTNAALCLLLSGTGLALLIAEPISSRRRWTARVIASLILGFGLLTLIENVAGWDFGIDQMLATESPGAAAVTSPNRMGIPASVCFSLAGLSLLLISRQSSRLLRAAQSLALGICLVALLGTIGHLYGIQEFYTIARLTGVAWTTAASLLLLGIGLLLARPDAGLMSQVSAADPGGANLRRWLPVLLLPILVGWLRLAGERAKLFDPASGTAIVMIFFIVALAVLAYTGARRVTRSSTEIEVSTRFLRLVNQAIDMRQLVQSAVAFLGQHSKCEAIGIRLKNHDDFPYYETGGFPEEFIRFENSLCVRDPDGTIQRDNAGNPRIACMCGNVICGRFDPSKEFFTPAGSFWTNSTTQLLANTTVADRKANTRNRCNGQGYESVALIPLGVGTQRLGLIQLNDRRKGMFTLETITLWERLANYLAVALSKFQADEDLRDSEQRYRSFVEASAQVVWTTNPRGEVNLEIPAWQAYTGQTAEQARGFGWMDAIHPDDRDRVAEAWAKAFGSRGIYEVEYRLRLHDGAWRDILARGVPVLSSSGQVQEYVGTCIDITERKKAEEALLQTVTELERSNKELEQFAYICAHDLQEPLRQVQGYVGLLKERYPETFVGKAAQYFAFISEGAARMSALVSGLLTYSGVRKMDKKRESVSCQTALDSAVAVLRSSLEDTGAQITHDPLPSLQADPILLTQLLQNLLSNAIRYRRDDTPPEVHVGIRDEHGSPVFFVRDNGIGIAPEFHEQVFQIFKRLHGRDKYPGTGIGLAICKRIVELHGGKIWIESNPGEGSTFCFTLSEA